MFDNASYTSNLAVPPEHSLHQQLVPDQLELFRLGASLAKHLADLNAEGYTLRDVSPSNIMVDLLAHECTLENQAQVEARRLYVNLDQFACLPIQVIKKKPITPACVTWQVGCCMLFLALGKNPYEGQDIVETMNRIERDEPDLSSAGRFADLCDFVLEQMRAGLEPKQFATKLEKKCDACQTSAAVDNVVSKRYEETLARIELERRKEAENVALLQRELEKTRGEMEEARKRDAEQAKQRAGLEQSQREQKIEIEKLNAQLLAQQRDIEELKQHFAANGKGALGCSHSIDEQLIQETRTRYLVKPCSCGDVKATSLDEAAENGCFRCCADRIQDAMKYDKTKGKPSALMVAAQHGDMDIVKLLFYHQKDFVDKDGKSVESYIDEKSPQELLLMFPNSFGVALVAAGKSRCRCGGVSRNLMQAAESGCLRCCAKYIDQVGQLVGDYTALMKAVVKEQLDVAWLLKHKETRIQTKLGLTALMLASRQGNIAAVRLLLKQEAKLQGSQGQTALMIAAIQNHVEIVKLLIPMEAKMQAKNGRTALMLIAWRGKSEAAKLLTPLEARMQDKNGKTALMLATRQGHLGIVASLLSAEAQMQGQDGVTALMIAASNGNLEAVTHLMKMEATFKDKADFTALMRAAQFGHADCVQLLLPYEAGMKQSNGLKAIHLAVARRQRKCAFLLMRNSKEVNEVPRQMLAALKGEVEGVLQMRETWKETTSDQLTILHFAMAGGSERCMRILLREEEMQKFFASKGVAFEHTKGDPSREIKVFLPMLLRKPDDKISASFANVFFDGNPSCARALMPFGAIAMNDVLLQHLEGCKSAEMLFQFLRLAKSASFTFNYKTLVDLNLACKKELARLVSQNPIYCKQIQLTKKLVARSMAVPDDRMDIRKGADIQQFAIRELQSESAFNRQILFESRAMCWKTSSSQRRPQDRRPRLIKAKQKRNWHLFSHAWKSLATVVQQRLEELASFTSILTPFYDPVPASWRIPRGDFNETKTHRDGPRK